jgi:hypothetical protein
MCNGTSDKLSNVSCLCVQIFSTISRPLIWPPINLSSNDKVRYRLLDLVDSSAFASDVMYFM